MSRSYRIKVRESLSRTLRAEDHVSTRLELLELLPCDQMGDLLGQELERRGFRRQGDLLVREHNGIKVEICPADGTVTVGAEGRQHVRLKGEKEGHAYDEDGTRGQVKETLKKQLVSELEQKAQEQTNVLRGQLTDRLEIQLGDLRRELDQAVNRVTAEALKIKAKQLGTIKQLTEDPQSGSLTIVLEV